MNKPTGAIDRPEPIGRAPTSAQPTVFVDLDGTLSRTDLFVEAILAYLKPNPLRIFRLVGWLARGRAVAKTMVARHTRLNVASLPYEQTLVDHLKGLRTRGHEIVLATSAHWTHARRVARHLNIFDDVIASNAHDNPKGQRKLERIQEWTGGAPFIYAGNGSVDRPIWHEAQSSILVNAPDGDAKALQAEGKLALRIESRKRPWRAFLSEMRVRQWAKNVLIFVPLITAHAYGDPGAVVDAVWAFLAFSLCASGVYFLNDLLDLEADRAHPTKRARPLASGDLAVAPGIAGALALPLAGFALSVALLPIAFVGVLALYLAITNAYSFFLKNRATVDVMTLAVLYTLRVVAGGLAIGVALSTWLLAFSIFVFVSLAYLKRYIEVAGLGESGNRAHGRSYFRADEESMFTLGVANATASVVVLALYINSDEVTTLYPNAEGLWLLCLVLLFWTNRLWVRARRGGIHEDPVVFAITDRVSQLSGLVFAAVVLLARYAPF